MSDQQNSPVSPQGAPASASPTPTEVVDTFESRLADVQAELRSSSPESAGEAGADAPPSEPASPAVSDDAAARAEARRARLAELAARERRNVDISTRLAERDKLARELEQERARAAELEKRTTAYVDPSKLDEASFFSLAERANIAPSKLGEWLRDAMANPERVATASARKAIDPELEAIRRENAELKSEFQAYLAKQEQREKQAEEQQAEQHILGAVQSDVAPITHAFLTQYGREEFLKVARSAGRTLPEGAGSQALIDTIEEHLEKLAPLFLPSTPTAPTPHRPAAAKAPTTVSNAMARERASVVDESSFDDLPYEERLSRIKRGFAA